jgi:hypothetical protein
MGAIWAGAILAAALSFVLLTLGTAIGLSATSPWPNSVLSAKVIASLAIFWVMAQQIGSFMVGGYVAGRTRSQWHDPTQHEAEFRDGLHGGLVWAVGIVIGAALVMATAGVASKTGAEVAGKAAASVASSTSDTMDLVVDTMLRTTANAQAAPHQEDRPTASNNNETRAEMSLILASAVARGLMTDQNCAYLAQMVSQRSGLSQQEVEKRVNDAFNAAREAADKARRAAILTEFVTAASLILSFGAAWWAARKGGAHRDNLVPARFQFYARRSAP